MTSNEPAAMLSEAQLRLLSVIVEFEADIHEAATQLGKPVWAISNTRNVLLSKGLIEYWPDYEAPMRLTDAGRAALKRGRSAPISRATDRRGE